MTTELDSSTDSASAAANAPRNGPLTVNELIKEIDAGLVDGILLITPDNAARCLSERVAAEGFVENLGRTDAYKVPLMLWGLDIEQEVRAGLEHVGGMSDGVPDVYLVPDLGTIRRVPWMPGLPVVICDPVDEEGIPIPFAPRQILRAQLARLEALGVTLQAATEVEFHLFDESYESAWHDGYRTLTPSTRYHAAYDSLAGLKSEQFIAQVIDQMNEAGVEVEGYASEYGLGQHEINLKHTTCLEMADRHFLYKFGVKTIAARLGRSVTFMAKWDIGADGSSCHVHVSLWGQDDAPLGEDPRFDGFVAGLAARAEAATLMYAPMVNSYRRFQPHSFAPTVIAVGDNNRTCSLRVVGTGAARRIENRIPGADANPYVVLGAIALSGADGIEAELAMPPLEEGDMYTRADAKQIPTSLYRALELFADSRELLEGLGPSVHAHLFAVGREESQAFLTETVTDWEKRRLFERA